MKTRNGILAMTCAGIILGSLAFSSSAYAQMQDLQDVRDIRAKNSVSVEPAVKPFGLLDLSKLRISHSYSLMYGSGSFGSQSFGMYTGSLLYEFSPKLSMDIAVGVGHDPGALFDSRLQANTELYPSVSLDYHPSDKFRMNVTVARTPYLGYWGFDGYNRYSSPYYRMFAPRSSGFGSFWDPWR